MKIAASDLVRVVAQLIVSHRRCRFDNVEGPRLVLRIPWVAFKNTVALSVPYLYLLPMKSVDLHYYNLPCVA